MIYLINTKTKEHIDAVALGDAEYERLAGSSGWIFQMADTDGWIECNGRECPLPAGAPCDVKHKDGEEFFNQRAGVADNTPGGFAEDWSHEARYFGGDIIAYRPIFDNKVSHPGTMAGPDEYRAGGVEPPAWDGEGLPPVGCECEWRAGANEWKRGYIIAKWSDRVWLTTGDELKEQVWNVAVVDFRPTRSEEDRAVEAMRNATSGKDDDANFYEAIYRAIRDGKVPGVKLTGG